MALRKELTDPSIDLRSKKDKNKSFAKKIGTWLQNRKRGFSTFNSNERSGSSDRIIKTTTKELILDQKESVDLEGKATEIKKENSQNSKDFSPVQKAIEEIKKEKAKQREISERLLSQKLNKTKELLQEREKEEEQLDTKEENVNHQEYKQENLTTTEKSKSKKEATEKNPETEENINKEENIKKEKVDTKKTKETDQAQKSSTKKEEEQQEEGPKADNVENQDNYEKKQGQMPKSIKYEIAEDKVLEEPPMIPEGEYHFPKGFLWGTSTSAYQVEGGIKNDWSEWEVSESRVAELKERGEAPEDFVCGAGVDHYNRYEEDIKLAAGLNNNAIRIGLEWARIQPEKDTWDVTVINHYKKVLQTAHDHGLKTVVTLWHWTNPLWLSEEGGWANKKVRQYFSDYVDFVIQELGGDIDYWITLNEPLMHVFGGYIRGYHPPAKHNIYKAEKCFRNLYKSHKLAYKKIHKHFPMARVSITGLVNYFEPAHYYNPIEISVSLILHYFWNHRFLSKIKDQLDYIGLDYYFHDRIVWYPPFKKNKDERVNDKGWEIYPEGILEVLRYLHRFKKPIIIMENGLADKHDKYRANFIKEHLYYIHRAIEEGIDVRGYFHWSLLDNFEWSFGWEPQFGFYKIDHKTFERIERPSASEYRKICKENKVIVLD